MLWQKDKKNLHHLNEFHWDDILGTNGVVIMLKKCIDASKFNLILA